MKQRLIASSHKLLKTSSGILLSQGLNIAFVPILARLYNPKTYAEFGFFLSLTVIFSGISSGKYSDAISTASSERIANILRRLSVSCVILFTLICAPFLFAIYWILHNSFLHGVYAVFSLLGLAIANIGLQSLVRQKKYASYTLVIFLVTGLVPILQAFLFQIPENGLLLGACISHSLAGIASAILLPKESFPTSLTLSNVDRAVIRRFRSFPLFALPSFFLSNLRARLVYFTLPSLPDKNFLGLYAQADRLLSAPTTLLSTALRPLATEALGAKTAPQALLIKYLKLQWYCLTPMMALVFTNTDLIIRIILGPKWLETISILNIMIFPSFFMMTTTWLDRFYDFTRKHSIVLRLEVSFGIAALLSLVIVGYAYHNPLLALIFFSSILCFYYLTWTLSLALAIGVTSFIFFQILFISVAIFFASFLGVAHFSGSFLKTILITLALTCVGIFLARK